jgi:hypothetical protein
MTEPSAQVPRGERNPLIDWKTALQAAVVPVIAAAAIGLGAAAWALAVHVLSSKPAGPQREIVSWMPKGDRGVPGIRVSDKEEHPESFIPWEALRKELKDGLLPRLARNPSNFDFVERDYYANKDWVVTIVDANGKEICWVWLGLNPDKGEFDGLVRIGGDKIPHVWATFQRFSDGNYRRVSASADLKLLEDMCKPVDRPCIHDGVW